MNKSKNNNNNNKMKKIKIKLKKPICKNNMSSIQTKLTKSNII